MEEPPPVPPKDHVYMQAMHDLRAVVATTSGSKRKRNARDGAANEIHNNYLQVEDTYEQSPKRARGNGTPSDLSVSEDTEPAKPRPITRKKGSRNLSNLNLRHAADQQGSQQAPMLSPTRESKFQEGSLEDKPSRKPPSRFTTMVRTQSGTLEHVDQLMTDYLDGTTTPRDSVDTVVEHHATFATDTAGEHNSVEAKKEDAKGFFRFGRQLASNFHPVTLWNRMWNDTKDELTRQNLEEALRKERQKKEAEARYLQLKQAGQLELQPVTHVNSTARSAAEPSKSLRDSAVAFGSQQSSFEQARLASIVSQPGATAENAMTFGDDVPASTNKTVKSFASRLHLKTPSLSNLRNDFTLKRSKSDYNLVAASQRESSSSISPVKRTFEIPSTLGRSASRNDLKKQEKLSKRVSELESKLLQARSELDDALVQASPMPKLTTKYERFSGSIRKPRFIPGKLPTLPSERVLMAEQAHVNNNMSEQMKESEQRTSSEAHPPLDVTLKQFLSERAPSDTGPIRETSQGAHAYDPTNVLEDEFHAPQTHSHKDQKEVNISPGLDALSQEGDENIDPNSIDSTPKGAIPEPTRYTDVNSKLKALDANVKIARKAHTPKKRKSGGGKEDKLFKPGKESDDESEWETSTPKRKRKSAESTPKSSPPKKRSALGASGSPRVKRTRGGAARTENSAFAGPREEEHEESAQARVGAAQQTHEDEYSADERFMRPDSALSGLDPVYEEEEEVHTTPVDVGVSKPTISVTTTRSIRSIPRSRSSSPNKRLASVRPSEEEEMITRAAVAAQNHPGRKGKSTSPPPADGHKDATKFTETEVVRVVPGENGVPDLPKGANGSFESLAGAVRDGMDVEVVSRETRRTSDFEWPDDVF